MEKKTDTKYLVVLLNYNNWQDTVECVESIQNNNSAGEILILDNGSINDSLSHLYRLLSRVKILDCGNNLGFAGGNNLGIKYGLEKDYPYIILLNNDTIVTDNSLDILISKMESQKDFSIGTGQIRWYPDKEKIWYAGGELISWKGLAVHNHFGKNLKEAVEPEGQTGFISGCYMCIRTAHIKNLGILEEKFFVYLEDIEYSARAARKGLKMLYVPESVIYHKWRGEAELKYNSLYYAVRNRLLLIDLAFPSVAKFYFNIVIRLKIIYWYFSNRIAFNAAVKGLDDYRNEYFGPIR